MKIMSRRVLRYRMFVRSIVPSSPARPNRVVRIRILILILRRNHLPGLAVDHHGGPSRRHLLLEHRLRLLPHPVTLLALSGLPRLERLHGDLVAALRRAAPPVRHHPEVLLSHRDAHAPSLVADAARLVVCDDVTIGRGTTRVRYAGMRLVDKYPTCQNVRFTARERKEVLKKRRATRERGRAGSGLDAPHSSQSPNSKLSHAS